MKFEIRWADDDKPKARRVNGQPFDGRRPSRVESIVATHGAQRSLQLLRLAVDALDEPSGQKIPSVLGVREIGLKPEMLGNKVEP